MMDRGHNRDSTQCHMKLKELKQEYQKAKETNRRSRTELQTCHFYTELQAILGGGGTTTTPALSVDSDDGVLSVTMPEDFADGEDDEEEVVEESTQHTVLPDSQELFLTLTEIPSQPFQGGVPDHEAIEGTSAANVSKAISDKAAKKTHMRRNVL
ncbi:trihelix transcription factor GTL1-like [Mauremys mutica]|uniref:trihelix transcription factor GTL1-like n=1 Tax=Mauremys mutica TaxID=74926 RepID=UPI001D167409|nr:trihelix transcription factor GTL1-like [Mauremys mutica]